MIGYDKISLNHQILLDLPFREATGAITRDVAKPHHQNVALINTPTWESLVSGLGVIDLNGTDQYLELATGACIDLNFTTGDYSIGCWFYWASGGGDVQHLMGRYDVDGPAFSGWEVYFYEPTLSLNLRHHHATTLVDGHPRTSYGSLGWTQNVWHFAGISRSGAVADIYRDGEAVVTTCSVGGLVDPETCAEDLTIGVRFTKGTEHFKSKLWRPRVWGRALSEGEWAQIFERERHWFGM